MELYIRGVTLVLLVMILVIFTDRAEAAIGVCNVRTGSSTSATRNQSPVRFKFSFIQSKPDFIFDPLRIEEYLVDVSSVSCVMTVYVKSVVLPRNPLPSIRVAGEALSCESRSEETLQVTGRVLSYMNQKTPKPAAVPESWYQGNRMVQELKFYTFPETSPVKIRCGVRWTVEFLGNIEVFADATVTKIGCPKSSYGNNCEKNCPCQNGGYCHTFEDSCYCPEGYDGNTCEINLGSIATSNNTAQISPSPRPDPRTSDPNTVSDDEPGGSSVRLSSRYSLVLCGIIFIFCSLFFFLFFLNLFYIICRSLQITVPCAVAEPAGCRVQAVNKVFVEYSILLQN